MFESNTTDLENRTVMFQSKKKFANKSVCTKKFVFKNIVHKNGIFIVIAIDEVKECSEDNCLRVTVD